MKEVAEEGTAVHPPLGSPSAVNAPVPDPVHLCKLITGVVVQGAVPVKANIIILTAVHALRGPP